MNGQIGETASCPRTEESQGARNEPFGAQAVMLDQKPVNAAAIGHAPMDSGRPFARAWGSRRVIQLMPPRSRQFVAVDRPALEVARWWKPAKNAVIRNKSWNLKRLKREV